jgi:hypothetical protein
LETDGALDTTYGVGGLVSADLGRGDIYQDAALQSNGNLVAVGNAYGVTTTGFAVGRHLAA